MVSTGTVLNSERLTRCRASAVSPELDREESGRRGQKEGRVLK